MKMNDFEFKTESLIYTKIEEPICNYCGFSYGNSSRLGLGLKAGESNDYHIFAKDGNIDCHISVGNSPNEGKYTIKVSNIKATRAIKRC